MKTIRYKFFSTLFTNIGHIVLTSFVIFNIFSQRIDYLIIFYGLIITLYFYLLGYIFIIRGGISGT